MMHPEYKEACTKALRAMKRVSNVFYPLAVQTNHHQFVEFNGLLVKYIELCEKALANDIDFVMNDFTAFPMEPWDIDYINEKLECIFSGLSFGVRKDHDKN